MSVAHCLSPRALGTFIPMTMEFKKIDPRVTITTKFGEIKIQYRRLKKICGAAIGFERLAKLYEARCTLLA